MMRRIYVARKLHDHVMTGACLQPNLIKIKVLATYKLLTVILIENIPEKNQESCFSNFIGEISIECVFYFVPILPVYIAP